jgi:hypothetical protein
MTQALPKFKPPQLIRPTLDTPFHIDYDWWDRAKRDLRVYLRSHLCSEHRSVFESHADTEEIDWIDEDTAEVTRVDGLQHVLRIHCSLQRDYITRSFAFSWPTAINRSRQTNWAHGSNVTRWRFSRFCRVVRFTWGCAPPPVTDSGSRRHSIQTAPVIRVAVLMFCQQILVSRAPTAALVERSDDQRCVSLSPA